MTDFKTIQFHPKHIDLMDLREIEATIDFSLPDSYERMEQVAKDSTQAATFILDGRVIFCAGFFPLWPGVYELWMIPTVHIKSLPVTFARLIRRYVDRIGEDFKAHRLQVTTHADDFHRNFAEFLGFDFEGRRKNFTHDKKDMFVFGRIF